MTQAIFTKFNGKAALGPWKKPLDFVGNQDHVTLGLVLGYIGLWLRLVGRAK